MSFDKTDEIFFKSIYKFQDEFEDIIDKSMDYKIDMTLDKFKAGAGKINVTDKANNTKECNYIIFCRYNTSNNEFEWVHAFKKFITSAIIKVYKELGIKLNTINKLIEKDKFIIEPKYKNIVPYMFALIYKQKINIIRFISGDIEFYVMIDLNIPNNIKDDDINKNFSLYNNSISKLQSRIK